MPDTKDTTGGRDYGRRPYASRQDYHATMRRQTDAFVGRYGKIPHSEDKKPYLEDLDYPEMEMFHFDWDDPVWPPWNPPTEPDTPGDPGPPPPVPPPYWPPKPPPTPFLGCFFYVPLTPNELMPGETAFAKLARREDPVVALEVHGPATIISSPTAVALCTAAGQEVVSGGPLYNAHHCTVIIRVNDDTSGYAPDERTGAIQIVLVATTASGSSCSTSATVKPCEGVDPLLWDWASSAETIGQPGSAAVYVLDGKPPFKWSVSGSGFTLAATRTSERSNTLVADGASCGTATITVKDACGTTAVGQVRSVDGEWVSIGKQCLSGCLGATPDGFGCITVGGQKCCQTYGPVTGTCGSSSCGGINCGNCDDMDGAGKSCRAHCLENVPAEDCEECVQFTAGGDCSWPCYCSGLCPSGYYLNLTCWRSLSLEAWEWRCAA